MGTQIVPEQIMYQNIRNHIYILPTLFKANTIIQTGNITQLYRAIQSCTLLYRVTYSCISELYTAQYTAQSHRG